MTGGGLFQYTAPPQLQEAIKEKKQRRSEVWMFEIWRVEILEKAALQVAAQTPSSQLPMSSKCAQYQGFFALKNITKPKISAIHPHNFSHLFFISVSEVACPWTSSYILSQPCWTWGGYRIAYRAVFRFYDSADIKRGWRRGCTLSLTSRCTYDVKPLTSFNLLNKEKFDRTWKSHMTGWSFKPYTI